MRISRGRLLLRAALLAVGGGFMAWRAVEAWQAARGQAEPGAVLAERLALVMALVGVLSLLTAGVALLQLRRKERRHSLHLRGPGPGTPRSGDP